VKDGEFGRLYVTYDVTAHTAQERIALLVLILGLAAIIAMAAWPPSACPAGWSVRCVNLRAA